VQKDTRSKNEGEKEMGGGRKKKGKNTKSGIRIVKDGTKKRIPTKPTGEKPRGAKKNLSEARGSKQKKQFRRKRRQKDICCQAHTCGQGGGKKQKKRRAGNLGGATGGAKPGARGRFQRTRTVWGGGRGGGGGVVVWKKQNGVRGGTAQMKPWGRGKNKRGGRRRMCRKVQGKNEKKGDDSDRTTQLGQEKTECPGPKHKQGGGGRENGNGQGWVVSWGPRGGGLLQKMRGQGGGGKYVEVVSSAACREAVCVAEQEPKNNGHTCRGKRAVDHGYEQVAVGAGQGNPGRRGPVVQAPAVSGWGGKVAYELN